MEIYCPRLACLIFEVCNVAAVCFPSEVEMGERQGYFFRKIYPYDLASKCQEVEIARG